MAIFFKYVKISLDNAYTLMHNGKYETAIERTTGASRCLYLRGKLDTGHRPLDGNFQEHNH